MATFSRRPLFVALDEISCSLLIFSKKTSRHFLPCPLLFFEERSSKVTRKVQAAKARLTPFAASSEALDAQTRDPPAFPASLSGMIRVSFR